MNDELHSNYSPIHDTTMVKVFLCGPLRLLRRENQSFDQLPSSYQDIPSTDWDERPGPTFNLLKLLLCCENRHASKTFLAGTLWPDSGEREARHSLSQAARALRSVLRMNGEELKSETKTKSLLFDSPGGEGFQIADQTLLWVDVDAFEEAMKQATRAERKKQSDEARTWWERAYTLGKLGTFLPDDVYQEWTNARRLNHELLIPRCVRRLAECYVAEERYEEAEEVLRPYWVTHLTDEDILTLLMQTLHAQGREREALLLYEQTKQALEEDGLDPLSRTADLAEHIRRKPFEQKYQLTSTVPTPLPSREILHYRTATNTMNIHPSVNPLPEVQENAWLTLGACYLGQLLTDSWSTSEILDATKIVLQTIQKMPTLNRLKLLGLSSANGMSSIPNLTSSTVHEDECIQLCSTLEKSIDAGWKLFHTASNVQVLTVGKALLHLLQQSYMILPSHRRNKLYSSVQNLIGKAFYFQGRYEEAMEAHVNAHIAALGSGELSEVARCLFCQADVYQALGYYSKAIQTIEEALCFLGNPTSEMLIRLKAHLLAGLADNALSMEEYIIAQQKLAESKVLLDGIAPNEEFDLASWFQLSGKYAFMLKEYETAIQEYTRALTELPPHWFMRQVFVLMQLLSAYTCVQNREGCLATTERLVTVVQSLNAPIINKYFTDTIQGVRIVFENDVSIQGFVTQKLRQIA